MVSEDVFAGDQAYRAKTLRLESRVGVRLLRQTFDWASIERSPHSYDFSAYDDYVAQTAKQRMRVLAILFDPPSFRSSRPERRAARGTYPPRDPRAMGDFAAALVRRYGPHGSLWSERPELPKAPIRAWQVWNEPSLPAYWPAGPDPAQYTRLLRATSRAIKRVDPGAEVVAAGLPESRLGIPFGEYLTGMYRAGASRWFDTLAIHPFARDEKGVIAAVSEGRSIMSAHGDAGKAIWVTEVGWATGGPGSPFTVGETGQAERIARTIALLAERRDALRVRGFVYFDWKDAPPYPGTPDFWGLHTGLLDIDGHPKPGLAAFRRAARALR